MFNLKLFKKFKNKNPLFTINIKVQDKSVEVKKKITKLDE